MTVTLDQLIATRIRQDVQGMHAYAVQDSRGMVKLDAMENPHRLPEALQKELGERLATVALNRYPGERLDDLRAELARHAQLPDGCALMLGNGSDELISLLALACDVPGAPTAISCPLLERASSSPKLWFTPSLSGSVGWSCCSSQVPPERV